MLSKIIELDKKHQFTTSWKYFTQKITCSISDWFYVKENEVIQKAKYVQIDLYENGNLFNWNILDENKTTIRTKHCIEDIVLKIFNEVVLPSI